MKRVAIIGMLGLTLIAGQAFASQILRCEKRSGFASKCKTVLSINLINAYLYEYEFARLEEVPGFCATQEPIAKSGTVFRSHYDHFENGEIEIIIDRTLSSNAFVNVFFPQGYTPDSFTSEKCESVFH